MAEKVEQSELVRFGRLAFRINKTPQDFDLRETFARDVQPRVADIINELLVRRAADPSAPSPLAGAAAYALASDEVLERAKQRLADYEAEDGPADRYIVAEQYVEDVAALLARVRQPQALASPSVGVEGAAAPELAPHTYLIERFKPVYKFGEEVEDWDTVRGTRTLENVPKYLSLSQANEPDVKRWRIREEGHYERVWPEPPTPPASSHQEAKRGGSDE